MDFQVKYTPFNTIIIHEIIKNSIEEYTATFNRQTVPNIRWIDGVVFDFGTFPKHPEVTNDEIKGIIHWSNLNFAILEEYQPTITDKKSGRTFNILNNENNKSVKKVIEWLKQQPFFND